MICTDFKIWRGSYLYKSKGYMKSIAKTIRENRYANIEIIELIGSVN
jgi:hypothetical protein